MWLTVHEPMVHFPSANSCTTAIKFHNKSAWQATMVAGREAEEHHSIGDTHSWPNTDVMRSAYTTYEYQVYGWKFIGLFLDSTLLLMQNVELTQGISPCTPSFISSHCCYQFSTHLWLYFIKCKMSIWGHSAKYHVSVLGRISVHAWIRAKDPLVTIVFAGSSLGIHSLPPRTDI